MERNADVGVFRTATLTADFQLLFFRRPTPTGRVPYGGPFNQ